MIVEQGKYYLYRHIRLDKNEPFYIGIGTKQEKEYQRMYSSKKGNSIWEAIAKKTEIEYEVIMESDDDLFIQEKEKEFIKLYGRICENNGGILSNIENGGRKGKENPNIHKKIYCCTNKKWYKSIKEASIELKLDRSSISHNINGDVSHTGGFIFSKQPCEILNKEEGWFPLKEHSNYYINIQKDVKRVDIILNNDKEIIKIIERFIKPVETKKYTTQITISENNKKTTVNLKKEYKRIFKKEWNEL